MAFGISAGAWLVAGATVAGGAIAASGSKKAADANASAANHATDNQYQMYQQTRDDQAPYRQAGYTALGQLGTGTTPGGEFNRSFNMNDYAADPGYQFRIAQGEQGINRAAIAGGARYSGATLKSLARFNSDQASLEYGNAWNRWNSDTTNRYNRLASVAGIGQTAANQTAAAGSAAANGMSQSIMSAGNARASGYTGMGNAVNGTLGSLVNNYQQQQMLNGFMNNGTGLSYNPGPGYGDTSKFNGYDAAANGGYGIE